MALRRVLGNETLVGILSTNRVAIMANIRGQVNTRWMLGIEIVEVPCAARLPRNQPEHLQSDEVRAGT